MEIIIDPKSGFCFGVERAIRIAELEATTDSKLFCLGDIVHNSEEINRLKLKGVEFISRDKFFHLSDCKVMIRAHGEPPETYEFAKKNNINLIDATCPVVLKLQDRIKKIEQINNEAQIVIFGRSDHPEVIGLKGQVRKVVIIESIREMDKIDFGKQVYLFAQTTKNEDDYKAIKDEIGKRLTEVGLSENDLITSNSICGQVANRAPWLSKFSKTVDAVIFVGGQSSSNSKVLFDVCRNANEISYFVTSEKDVEGLVLDKLKKIGVCGATSTPSWLIKKVADRLRELNNCDILS